MRKQKAVVVPAESRWLNRRAGSTAGRAGQGPTSATVPSTSTTTLSARASAARFESHRPPCAPLPQGGPQLDLGRGVEGAGDVVGEQQLGVGGQRPREREALHLTSGQPHAAVPDERVGPPASSMSSASRAPRIGPRDPDGWSSRTLSENVPDSTRGTWATWATWAGRKNAWASLTSTPFQRTWPVCSTSPASADSRRLARSDLPEQQHQLTAPDLEVDVVDADRAVVVHRAEVRSSRRLQRLAPGRLGCRRLTGHQVDAARAALRSAPPANRRSRPARPGSRAPR